MNTTAAPTVTPHPAVTALTAALDQTVAALTHDALVGLGPDALLATLHSMERLRNRLQVIDHELVAAADTIGLPDRHAVPNLARFLTAALRIEHADAKARVAGAEALRPATTMTGNTLPAPRPVVAGAVRAGHIGASHVAAVAKAVTTIGEHGASDAQQAQAETELVEHARVLAPGELRRVAHRLVELFDPDGTLTDEAGHQARRRVSLTQRRDGTFHLEGRLTTEVGEQLTTVLEPLSRPQSGPDGTDLRDVQQRTHDALGEIAARLLRSGGLPETGGIPATVVINVDIDTLDDALTTTNTTTSSTDTGAGVGAGVDTGPGSPRVSRDGSGRFADGTPVSLRGLMRLADQAEIVFVFRDSLTGAVPDLGGTKRCASKEQTLALYARDKGCSFPGCDRPPQWCERHHVIAWLFGGLTDIDNLTLVCRYHHHNFERLGWQCRMEAGIPVWYPPGYLDRARTPMINNRIRPPTLHTSP